MKVSDLFCCQTATDLFFRNGTEYNRSILKPGLAPLKHVHNDVCIKKRSHSSFRRSSLASSRVVVCGRIPNRDSAISIRS